MREWEGGPCVCGCEQLRVDYAKKVCHVDSEDGKPTVEFHEGEWVSLNGTTGEIIRGQQPVKDPEMSGGQMIHFHYEDATGLNPS